MQVWFFFTFRTVVRRLLRYRNNIMLMALAAELYLKIDEKKKFLKKLYSGNSGILCTIYIYTYSDLTS